ncbi:hypothetical protein GCM10022631_11420 [Deinococcus rubellus]|uniref:hypothetical protein n=1 Tax=Deinococcus rubellus TaxID=1889240 RepID=UPI0031EA95BC
MKKLISVGLLLLASALAAPAPASVLAVVEQYMIDVRADEDPVTTPGMITGSTQAKLQFVKDMVSLQQGVKQTTAWKANPYAKNMFYALVLIKGHKGAVTVSDMGKHRIIAWDIR